MRDRWCTGVHNKDLRELLLHHYKEDGKTPYTIAAITEAHFACHGVPETISTDNEPQFIASDFERLCLRYQTKHVTNSPYWFKGNGKSEASVKLVKHILKKSGKNGLYEALLV